MGTFEVGKKYSRRAIQESLGVPKAKRGGDWNTGYTEYDGAFYLFCNVGTPGRTGHDYGDMWRGAELVWSGKTGAHLDQRRVKRLISGEFPVFVFWRTGDRDDFTFAGKAAAKDVLDETPVKVVWTFPEKTIDQ
jgi:5-methylcytosine-specific restriction protein A